MGEGDQDGRAERDGYKHCDDLGKRSCNSLQILSDLLEEEGLGLLYVVQRAEL